MVNDECFWLITDSQKLFKQTLTPVTISNLKNQILL